MSRNRHARRRAESSAVPSFTIDAEDPIASGLVMIWACFRNGDLAGALREFNDLAQSEAVQAFEDAPDEANAARAVTLAEDMEDWTDQGEG